MRNHITSCIHQCHFFETCGHDMECSHPDFDADPDPYAGSIITWENGGNGVIPEKCPLRKADLTMKKKVTRSPFHGVPKVISKTEITYSLLTEAEAEFAENKFTLSAPLHFQVKSIRIEE